MKFLYRVGRYGLNRIQPEAVRETSSEALSGGGRRALEALRPGVLDLDGIRTGLDGRHADGGAGAFLAEMRAQGLSEADLDAIQARHQRASSTSFLVAIALLLLAALLIILSPSLLIAFGAVPCLLFALGAAVIAIQSDYAAWQVEQRRFPGLRVYLCTRFLGRD